MWHAVRYDQTLKGIWDRNVANSKNATFLFLRDYMDYHSSRFEDFSLLLYKGEELKALMPANRDGQTIYSHQGLTYGGLLLSHDMTAGDVKDALDCANNHFRSCGIREVVYKKIPSIYASLPAEEDIYFLWRDYGASIIGRNLSSAIYRDAKMPFSRARKSGLKKAAKARVTVVESVDYASFWSILTENLKRKYGVCPVHSLDEMLLLSSRFPENIKLFLALKDDEVLGGTVVYLTGKVVHTQYISANAAGKSCGAIDAIMDYLINDRYAEAEVFDFGQSTEHNGMELNESLLFQKEGFGARGVCYDIYHYNLFST